MATAYISTSDIDTYFVDKDTGAPLSGGTVYFYQDNARTTPKAVYQKQNVGADPVTGSPTYQYVALPNPITLSAVGTPQDASGNNVTIYYYPYDSSGNSQLYYIAVYNSLGVPEFTREGWPSGQVTEISTSNTSAENLISNPQFADVSFIPANGLSYTYSGTGTTNINIAPDWVLNVGYTGAGTVTVARNAVTGSSNYPTNPAYTLTITAGLNCNLLTLTQQLTNNPGIWAPQTSSVGGYVASAILLSPSTQATITYTPSIGTATQLLTANNTSSVYTQYTATVELPPSANTATSDAGYSSIVISLPTSGASTLSSVQVSPVSSNVTGIQFIQDTVNRQKDHLFNYYNPLLQAKPIKSYLTGWDFPVNPAQFNGSTVAAFATGVNTSSYFWDQLIVFQSANSGVSAAKANDKSLVLTAAATTQLALINYVDGGTVSEMLSGYLSVNLRGFTNQVGGVPCTISIYYTTSALPNVAAGTNKSIVATLDANGKPATFNNTWVEVARSNLGNAFFTLAQGTTYTDYGFSNWLDTTGGKDFVSGYIAVVVGFGSLTSGNTITIQSISCVPGQIATRPEPLSINETLINCQRYYWTTIPLTSSPVGTGKGVNGSLAYTAQIGSTTAGYTLNVPCPIAMRDGATITYYNPVNANAKWYNNTLAADSGIAATNPAPVLSHYTSNFGVNNPQVAGDSAGNLLIIHLSADCRLGIV